MIIKTEPTQPTKISSNFFAQADYTAVPMSDAVEKLLNGINSLQAMTNRMKQQAESKTTGNNLWNAGVNTLCAMQNEIQTIVSQTTAPSSTR